MSEGATLSVRLRQHAPIPLDVAFTAPAGAITALFGPSGSGKTTVLRSIAGLYVPSEATILCGDTCWTRTADRVVMPAHRRPVGVVFQEYALFPHMTVREQVGLSMSHVERNGRPARVAELLDLVHLTGLADRKPATLSGGQQQRVAMARALARDPEVLLLDEPFASVDWSLRESLRRELVRLHGALPLAIILVTHDFDDVAKLATHLVVLDQGVVAASGSVEDLTARNALPAAFPREPGVSIDMKVLEHDEARELTQIGTRDLRLWIPPVAAAAGTVVRAQIAARDVILATHQQAGLSLHNALHARIVQVDESAERGLRLVHLAVGGTRLLSLVTADAMRSLELEAGARVMALIKAVAVESFL